MLWLIACAPGNAPPTPQQIEAFARDSMPLDSMTGWPADSAIDALLERLGVPYEPALAVVDSGCVLGGSGKAIPPVQRVTCHMRGNAEPIEIEVSLDEFESATLRVFNRIDTSFQQLDAGDHEPFDTRDHYLFTVDVDGDGTRELLVRQFRGGTGNRPVAENVAAERVLRYRHGEGRT